MTAQTEDVSYATDDIVVISGTLLDEDNNPVVNQTVSCDGITAQTDATGSYQIELNAELTDSSLLSQSFTKTIQFEGVSGQYNPTSKTVTYSVHTMYAINFDPNKDHGGDAYIGSKNGYDAQLIYFFSDFDHGMLGNGDKNNPPFMDGIYFAKILRGKSYAFLGWAYDKDATVPDFKENDSFNNLIAPDEIVTLYAIWEDPIKITRIDAVVDEPIEGNTITRNLFLSVTPEEATIIQGPNLIFPQVTWHRSKTLKYTSDSWSWLGTGDPIERGYYYLATIEAKFDGELTSSTQGFINDEEHDSDFMPLYDPKEPDKTLLFRVWYLPTLHTVSFDIGIPSDIAPQTVEHGNTVAKPNNPIRANLHFTGWYTDSNCTDLFDFSIPIEKDMTLYAGWTNHIVPPTSDNHLLEAALLFVTNGCFIRALVSNRKKK